MEQRVILRRFISVCLVSIGLLVTLAAFFGKVPSGAGWALFALAGWYLVGSAHKEGQQNK